VRMTILLDVRYSALRTTEVVHGSDSLIEILDNLNYKGSLPYSSTSQHYFFMTTKKGKNRQRFFPLRVSCYGAA